MANSLETAVAELAEATRGVDWNAERTQTAIDAIRQVARQTPPTGLTAAVEALAARMQQFRADLDADGTGHVAITGGTLIEMGAAPAALSAVLLDKLPSVLTAARRYADRCLADPRTPEEMPEEEVDVLFEVDERPITREVFRSYLTQDRPAAACLYQLEHWVLPCAAAWTRDREALKKAAANRALVDLAEQLSRSNAYWLRPLLGMQVDAAWLVLCPVESRGFEVRVDGIASNYDLHALLAAALVPKGISGKACDPKVIAYLEGRAAKPPTNHISGTWNLYDYRAAAHNLSRGEDVPTDVWVWGEGIPTDVPRLDDTPTLLVGQSSIARSWGIGRPFSAVQSRVTVERELTSNEYCEKLARAKTARSEQ